MNRTIRRGEEDMSEKIEWSKERWSFELADDLSIRDTIDDDHGEEPVMKKRDNMKQKLSHKWMQIRVYWLEGQLYHLHHVTIPERTQWNIKRARKLRFHVDVLLFGEEYAKRLQERMRYGDRYYKGAEMEHCQHTSHCNYVCDACGQRVNTARYWLLWTGIHHFGVNRFNQKRETFNVR